MFNAPRFGWLLAGIAFLPAVRPSLAAGQALPAADRCIACHVTQPDAKLSAPATLFSQQDVHRERGFRCIDCHGGDGAAADKGRAHDASRGFKGAPSGTTQVSACARCHSDAEFMRRFSPRQHVDQAAEFATSVHGKQLAAGDRRVATCASCHGAHGVRLVKDAKSPVFPTNVAATCARCHASEEHMRGYTVAGGALPTNQLDEYRKSVHHAALTKGNDLSAPTCNDCHGNHGAAPPGVGAVANVCGTCHTVFAQKFSTSVHAQIFDKACVECHGNHAVLEPSDDLLGSGPHTICGTCHSGADDKGAAAADSMRAGIGRLSAGIAGAGGRVARLTNAGMEMSAQELALGEARSRITLARTELHAFDAARLDPIVADGLKIVSGVDTAAAQAAAELRYRRRGLAWSLGAILLVVIALGLKVRQLGHQR